MKRRAINGSGKNARRFADSYTDAVGQKCNAKFTILGAIILGSTSFCHVLLATNKLKRRNPVVKVFKYRYWEDRVLPEHCTRNKKAKAKARTT